MFVLNTLWIQLMNTLNRQLQVASSCDNSQKWQLLIRLAEMLSVAVTLALKSISSSWQKRLVSTRILFFQISQLWLSDWLEPAYNRCWRSHVSYGPITCHGILKLLRFSKWNVLLRNEESGVAGCIWESKQHPWSNKLVSMDVVKTDLKFCTTTLPNCATDITAVKVEWKCSRL